MRVQSHITKKEKEKERLMHTGYVECVGSKLIWCKMLKILRILTDGMKEMFYLMTHSTHFIYGYMASNIW